MRTFEIISTLLSLSLSHCQSYSFKIRTNMVLHNFLSSSTRLALLWPDFVLVVLVCLSICTHLSIKFTNLFQCVRGDNDSPQPPDYLCSRQYLLLYDSILSLRHLYIYPFAQTCQVSYLSISMCHEWSWLSTASWLSLSSAMTVFCFVVLDPSIHVHKLIN